jgi:polyketide synthase PksM
MTREQLIFSANNPAIAGHKIDGQLVLPGLAYIDIFCQFSKKLGLSLGQFELRHLTIHNPMIVDRDSKLVVSVVGEEHGQGYWKVRLEGRKLFATVEIMSVREGATHSDLNIDIMKQSAKRAYPVSNIYARYRKRGLSHEGFIRSAGEIYELSDGLIFQGLIGPEARATAEGFMFHPALMDGCAIATMHLFDDLIPEEEGIFLPFYLESFFGTAPINKYCNAYVSREYIGRKNEVLTLSTCFFDETGKWLAKITDLSSKLVGDAVRIRPMQEKKDVTGNDALVLFLKELIGRHFGIDPNAIDPQLDFYHLGFDSVSLLKLAEVIGVQIGADLPPTVLFEHSSIAALAGHLSAVHTGNAGALNFIE